MGRTKLQGLNYLDKILNALSEAKDPRFQLNTAEILQKLSKDHVFTGLKEALNYLKDLGYIKLQHDVVNDRTTIYDRKEVELTFKGQLFLEESGGFVERRTNEIAKRKQLENLQKFQLTLTFLLVLGTLVAAAYYVLEMANPYRHIP